MWDFKNKTRGAKMTNKDKSKINKIVIHTTLLNDKSLNIKIGILIRNTFKDKHKDFAKTILKQNFSHIIIKLNICEN